METLGPSRTYLKDHDDNNYVHFLCAYACVYRRNSAICRYCCKAIRRHIERDTPLAPYSALPVDECTSVSGIRHLLAWPSEPVFLFSLCQRCTTTSLGALPAFVCKKRRHGDTARRNRAGAGVTQELWRHI